jgi:hypothetical protein
MVMKATILSSSSSAPIVKQCSFFGKNGHLQPYCYAYAAVRKAAQLGNSKAKKQQATHVSEFIGTAAVHLLPTSISSNHPQLTAQLAVTGASSTMTPYCSWFFLHMNHVESLSECHTTKSFMQLELAVLLMVHPGHSKSDCLYLYYCSIY